MYGRNLRKKGHGRELPLAKTNLYKDSFLMRCVYKHVLFWNVNCASEENLFKFLTIIIFTQLYVYLSIFVIFLLFLFQTPFLFFISNCVRLSY